MKMYFKQRFFSWFDSYDVYDENGNTLFEVKGQLAWGHKLKVFDAQGNYLGMVREQLFRLTPTFDIYVGDDYIGRIKRDFFSFLKPSYTIDFNGWSATGSFWEWDYSILNADGSTAATVSKELFHWTDHYSIEVADPNDALCALMFVLAIDAEKCSRD